MSESTTGGERKNTPLATFSFIDRGCKLFFSIMVV